LRQQPLGIVAVFVLGIIILSILFLPFIYQVSPQQIDFSQSSLPPNLNHLLGTNDRGQDQLARILLGGRISLAVGLMAMLGALIIGTSVGAVAGFYGGVIEGFLMGLTDLFLSLPQLPLLLLIVYLFRESITKILGAETGIFCLIVLAIALFNWMSVARLVRGNFLKIKQMEFITAAKALGAKPLRLIAIHMLPNVLGIILVAATLTVGNAIITESTLSFLGLGFPPDVPTWGRMLYEGKEYLNFAPHIAIFPGLAIFLTVLSINYLGDALRDIFDPRQ
ncbi:MAG: ABC transporter permease, partial [Cyanobacteria bacterium J083]